MSVDILYDRGNFVSRAYLAFHVMIREKKNTFLFIEPIKRVFFYFTFFQNGVVPAGSDPLDDDPPPPTSSSIVTPSVSWCPPLFEGASCFPATPPGTLRVIPCMESYAGVLYNTSGRRRPRLISCFWSSHKTAK